MQEKLHGFFRNSECGSTVPQEVIAGSSGFLAMVYTIIVIPGMPAEVGFDQHTAFVSTCLVAAFGSLLMGLWANLPVIPPEIHQGYKQEIFANRIKWMCQNVLFFPI